MARTGVGTPTEYTIGTPANSFVTITLTTPIVLTGPGDIIIALSNPNAANVGSRPAILDGGPFLGRSWIGDAPADGLTNPDLSTLELVLNNDPSVGVVNKNYMAFAQRVPMAAVGRCRSVLIRRILDSNFHLSQAYTKLARIFAPVLFE